MLVCARERTHVVRVMMASLPLLFCIVCGGRDVSSAFVVCQHACG